MRKVITLLALIALIATPVLARQAVTFDSVVTSPASLDRDDVELGYDDGIFSGFGSTPDWSDMTIGVFEAPAGDWTLTTMRIYFFGDQDHAVMMDDTADLATAPAAPYATTVTFNAGTTAFDESVWLDVDMGSLGLVYAGGEIIAVGVTFDGADGVGLSDCVDGVDCGYYWASYDGAWGLDSAYAKNNGIRVVVTGQTASEAASMSSVKALY
ncbi:MAG: hypothetical protein GY835_13855 [bacterium]|nr:hypothetical protein [bacterium]